MSRLSSTIHWQNKDTGNTTSSMLTPYFPFHCQQQLLLLLLLLGDDEFVSSSTPFLVAFVALAVGVAARTFTNQMLEGDRGLGAF